MNTKEVLTRDDVYQKFFCLSLAEGRVSEKPAEMEHLLEWREEEQIDRGVRLGV